MVVVVTVVVAVFSSNTSAAVSCSLKLGFFNTDMKVFSILSQSLCLWCSYQRSRSSALPEGFHLTQGTKVEQASLSHVTDIVTFAYWTAVLFESVTNCFTHSHLFPYLHTFDAGSHYVACYVCEFVSCILAMHMHTSVGTHCALGGSRAVKRYDADDSQSRCRTRTGAEGT